MADVRKVLMLLFVLRTQHTLCMVPLRDATTCDKKRLRSSYLWRLESQRPIYLFGTMHVPYTLVWEHIAPVAKQAFYAAKDVYFELDLTDPETVTRLDTCQILPRQQNLSKIIPADLYKRLQRYFAQVRRFLPYWLPNLHYNRSLYAEFLFNSLTHNWQRKRPIWLMLLINNMTPEEIHQRGVPVLDVFLQQEAHRRNKQSGAMETVREQCQSLNRLSMEQAIFALNLTLSFHESRLLRQRIFERQPMQSQEGAETGWNEVAAEAPQDDSSQNILRSYNCGHLKSLLSQGVMQIKTKMSLLKLSSRSLKMAAAIDAYFQREIIERRNVRMSRRIAELARYNASPLVQDKNNHNSDRQLDMWNRRSPVFVALGAGHLMGGNNSVVEQLRAQGFVINAVPRGPDKFHHFLRRKTSKPRLPNVHFQDLWEKVNEREIGRLVIPPTSSQGLRNGDQYGNNPTSFSSSLHRNSTPCLLTIVILVHFYNIIFIV